MTQNEWAECLYVFRANEISAVKECHCLSGAHQQLTASGAHSQNYLWMFSG